MVKCYVSKILFPFLHGGKKRREINTPVKREIKTGTGQLQMKPLAPILSPLIYSARNPHYKMAILNRDRIFNYFIERVKNL